MKRHTDYLTCPKCGKTGVLPIKSGGMNVDFVVCEACGHTLPVIERVPDFAEHIRPETTHLPLSQRLMETKIFARMYETPIWRPLHTRLSTGMTQEEQQTELVSLGGAGVKESIVDLACGTGHFTRALAMKWPDAAVFGFDLSFSMLSQAVRQARHEDLTNVAFLRGSIFSLPFVSGSIDHVNCCGALHLFQDQAVIWKEVARILKPGAIFAAEAVRLDPKIEWIQRRVQKRKGARFLEPEVVLNELTAAGFEQIEFTYHRAIVVIRAVRSSEVLATTLEGGNE